MKKIIPFIIAMLLTSPALADKKEKKEETPAGVSITNSPGAKVVNGVCVNGKCNGTVTTCDGNGKCTTKKL